MSHYDVYSYILMLYFVLFVILFLLLYVETYYAYYIALSVYTLFSCHIVFVWLYIVPYFDILYCVSHAHILFSTVIENTHITFYY